MRKSLHDVLTEKPTEKQKGFISLILSAANREYDTGLRCRVATKLEATKWISEYCGIYYERCEAHKAQVSKWREEKLRKQEEENKREYEAIMNERRKRQEWEDMYWGKTPLFSDDW